MAAPIRSNSSVRQPLHVAPQPVKAAASAPAPKLNPKASADPIPNFSGPGDYKIYAIRQIGAAIAAQVDLQHAQEGLRKGTATQADVNQAARNLNDIRDQLRDLKDSVHGWRGFIWKWFHGFDNNAFWKSEGVDLSTMAVTPKATDLIYTIKGPTAEALKAAMAAIDKGNWNDAENAFAQAAAVATTENEALVAGEVASGLRFDISADNCYHRAAELSTSTDEALEVAVQAASNTNYKYHSVDYAFRRGADLAKSKDEALSVANKASSMGYTDASSYAFQKAQGLK